MDIGEGRKRIDMCNKPVRRNLQHRLHCVKARASSTQGGHLPSRDEFDLLCAERRLAASLMWNQEVPQVSTVADRGLAARMQLVVWEPGTGQRQQVPDLRTLLRARVPWSPQGSGVDVPQHNWRSY